MTSIILAGGRSTRLGRDKVAEVVGGQSLLQRAFDVLAPISTEVIVVVDPGQGRLPLRGHASWRRVEDIFPGRGSLVGLYSGLREARDFHSLVVAADMPFLNAGLLSYMMRLASSFDVTIPHIDGHLEPLHAVYSKSCLGFMEKLLGQGILKILDFFPQVRVRYVEEGEVDRFDSQRLSFFNVNTEADLARARALAGEGGS